MKTYIINNGGNLSFLAQTRYDGKLSPLTVAFQLIPDVENAIREENTRYISWIGRNKTITDDVVYIENSK